MLSMCVDFSTSSYLLRQLFYLWFGQCRQIRGLSSDDLVCEGRMMRLQVLREEVRCVALSSPMADKDDFFSMLKVFRDLFICQRYTTGLLRMLYSSLQIGCHGEFFGSQNANLWHPFRIPTFRNLLIADVVSDVGTFMQSVGAAWLMVSLHAGPLYVALIQTASALPFFVFALPAGALGDIVDRRKLILLAEMWMAGVAIVLSGTTIAGRITPALLLILTFALSAGDAFESPTWRAVLPELVSKEDLAPAAALNGIEFNFARAIGPALGGIVIAIAGVSTAFLINAVSSLGVILVIAQWKRHVRKRTTTPETLSGATIAGIRYVRYSPALRAVLLRSGIVMFFASGLLALLPSVAQSVNKSPIGYGVLLGCFGFGAVLGAMVMQQARARWSAEVVVSSGVLILGLATVSSGFLRFLPTLAAAMLAGGAAWIVFISLFNVVDSDPHSQLGEGPGARSVDAGVSRSHGRRQRHMGCPSNQGEHPCRVDLCRIGNHRQHSIGAISGAARCDRGPHSLGTLACANHTDRRSSRRRRRTDSGHNRISCGTRTESTIYSGDLQVWAHSASRRGVPWDIFRDLEKPELYLEIFLVDSWAEHMRQHERLTMGDRASEEHVFSHVRGAPIVRHLVYTALDR